MSHERTRGPGSSGYSLIELIVVVAVVGLLLAVATPLLLASRPGDELQRAAWSLNADLREARTMALTGQLPGRPGLPSTLEGVEVRFIPSGPYPKYEVWALFGASASPERVKEVKLDADSHHATTIALAVSPASPSKLRFLTNGLADRRTFIQLSASGSGVKRTVEVTRAGLCRVQ